MNQEQANKIFETSLGQQLNEIFVTSDNRSFIRHKEALLHSQGKLDVNTEPLSDTTIITWYPEEPEQEHDKLSEYYDESEYLRGE